jgi:hypothetical protein
MGVITDILKEIPLSAVLREKIIGLETKMSVLEAENLVLKEALKKSNFKINQQTEKIQTLEKLSIVHSNNPLCPNCSTPDKPFYMAPLPIDFIAIMNATHECSKCKYNTKI